MESSLNSAWPVMALVKRSTQVFPKKKENISDFTIKPHIGMMECKLNEALTELEIVTLYIRENILTKLKLLARIFQIAQI